MKYLVETFGCQMNYHDSERMAGLLEQAGYDRTEDDRDADVIVINTCSVREKAEEKLYTRLGEIRVLGEETGNRPLVAVVGPSGAGKSSLLHMAGLLEAPTGGEVFIEGIAASALPDQERTRIRRDCVIPK